MRLRRLALLMPINNKGQILLQHRTADAPIKPDHWAFFGGHIEEGEHAKKAAEREFKEELQAEAENLKFFYHYIFDEERDGEWEKVERFYYSFPFHEDVAKLKSQQLEGDNLGYFGPDDLDGLKISENDRRVLDLFFNVLWYRP